MTEELKTKKSVRGRKKNPVAKVECNEDCYGSFALLRNDGTLPLKSDKNVAIVECKKNKGIATAQVLSKALSQSVEKVAHVCHVFGQKSPKGDIKTIAKQLKKFPVVILYIRSEAKGYIAEVEQLATYIRKHSSLIICYHKIGNLLSSSLISKANSVIACFNKDKEEGKALCNIMLGNVSPFARVNINASEPFNYEYLSLNANENDFMGFGASYVNFSYTNVSLSRYTAKVGEITEVQAMITNNSQTEASEIAQLYITPAHTFAPKLIDYGVVKINACESVTVSFNVNTSNLDYSSFEDNEAYTFYVCVGKSSTDVIRIPFRVIF